ncbi:MAG: ankyrin repeat domain-containing protein [Gammaproteobacteria bacterium]|nr:ankyrin repeat domain-containing protein [Gammaproteobacteria bacterium]MCH9745000.1 ankyrin repeat domain-containing protein [Gammaproteobacteria bacterium]
MRQCHKILANDLIEAVIHNDSYLVNDLLHQGVDPNYSLDSAGVTPLHYAAQNNSLEVIPLLVQAGARVDAQTQPDGLTPMDIAAVHDHFRVIQVLVAYLEQDSLLH